MSFVPKTQPSSGKINAVTLGTGDKAIVIGGQNVMPFYTFDAAIEHAPKIGIEISDLATQWDAPALKEFYAGCTTMVDFAKKAETMPGAAFRLCGRRQGCRRGDHHAHRGHGLQDHREGRRAVQQDR